MDEQRRFDRRGFLKGSALFAAAGVLAALPASAQEPAAPASAGDAKKEEPAEKKPEEKKKGALYDKQGREYRVCDMCGSNMYVEEKRWTCEQCGFSYEV